ARVLLEDLADGVEHALLTQRWHALRDAPRDVQRKALGEFSADLARCHLAPARPSRTRPPTTMPRWFPRVIERQLHRHRFLALLDPLRRHFDFGTVLSDPSDSSRLRRKSAGV